MYVYCDKFWFLAYDGNCYFFPYHKCDRPRKGTWGKLSSNIPCQKTIWLGWVENQIFLAEIIVASNGVDTRAHSGATIVWNIRRNANDLKSIWNGNLKTVLPISIRSWAQTSLNFVCTCLWNTKHLSCTVEGRQVATSILIIKHSLGDCRFHVKKSRKKEGKYRAAEFHL